MRIVKDDRVQVIAGKDKGKIGKVLSVDLKTGRITVEKVSVVKKHRKPTQKNPQGGIVEKETSIDFSNVLLFCPKCNKGVRFGVQMGAAKKTGASEKTRVCRKCKSSLNS